MKDSEVIENTNSSNPKFIGTLMGYDDKNELEEVWKFIFR